jgi:hypothetical protein
MRQGGRGDDEGGTLAQRKRLEKLAKEDKERVEESQWRRRRGMRSIRRVDSGDDKRVGFKREEKGKNREQERVLPAGTHNSKVCVRTGFGTKS